MSRTRSFEIGLLHPPEVSSESAVRFMEQSAAFRRMADETTETQHPESWTWKEYKSYPRFASGERSIAVVERASRQTVRKFGTRPIRQSDIDLVVARSMLQNSQSGSRGYPSAGGRYPVESYLCVLHQGELAPGVYYIDKVHAKYVRLFDEAAAAEVMALSVDASASGAAVLFVHTAMIARSMIKYGGRGLRFSLIEVGAVAMKLEAEFEGLGISSFWVGGFDDRAVGEALGINSGLEMEYPLLVQAFGYAGSP